MTLVTALYHRWVCGASGFLWDPMENAFKKTRWKRMEHVSQVRYCSTLMSPQGWKTFNLLLVLLMLQRLKQPLQRSCWYSYQSHRLGKESTSELQLVAVCEISEPSSLLVNLKFRAFFPEGSMLWSFPTGEWFDKEIHVDIANKKTCVPKKSVKN